MRLSIISHKTRGPSVSSHMVHSSSPNATFHSRSVGVLSHLLRDQSTYHFPKHVAGLCLSTFLILFVDSPISRRLMVTLVDEEDEHLLNPQEG